jgi:hypothetical protein
MVDSVLAASVGAARDAQKNFLSRFAQNDHTSIGDRRAVEFVVVSSLAEGSDRIVAESGLAAGFSLEAVLPFARSKYARDFETDRSKSDFAQLIERATSVLELDGADSDKPRAYEAAGILMLNNIDLLIAIWDGSDASGIGGTEKIVSAAIAARLPVVWIDPATPNLLQLSRPHVENVLQFHASPHAKETFHAADINAVGRTVHDILSPPAQADITVALENYLNETVRRWNFCPWFPLLLRIFTGRPIRSTEFNMPEPLQETQRQWREYFDLAPADTAQRTAIETILLPAYSITDQLAVYYSQVYRSAYVFNFSFAAIAVALALCGIFTHDIVTKSFFVTAELAVIATILITWLRGQRLQWHRRWLEYRRLAEGLRHIRILALVGSRGPDAGPQQNADASEQDWVNWYLGMLRRLIPLPNRAVDVVYIDAVRDAVRSSEIAEQLRYHTANAERFDKLNKRMHRCGQWLFGATGILCLLFLCFAVIAIRTGVTKEDMNLPLEIFTFVTALLPTLGAAFGAIHAQGYFNTVAEQSRHTAMRLALVDRTLASEPPDFARLADRIETTSEIMLTDLLEWHTIFRTRPLSLPA